MDMNTSMTVVLPEDAEISKAPVVYLFHGLADNCSGWSRYTGVERYARKYNVSVVIPEVQRSYYSDMQHGLPYFKFIHDELPKICGRLFGIPAEKKFSYVMGLSMGGYAALKCALHSPERYTGCAAFSAAADIRECIAGGEERQKKEYAAIFGPDFVIPEEADLFALAKKADGTALPRFYMAVGEQDEFFEQDSRFAELLRNKGAEILFEHWEGMHNWDFWDKAVCRAFDRMFADPGV